MHKRPLIDAMENGFRSIEADVFTVGDSLYVAHNRKDIKPGRSAKLSGRNCWKREVDLINTDDLGGLRAFLLEKVFSRDSGLI